MRTGIANLPLHYGKTPRWLFERMARLAREITIAIVTDFGPQELVRRVSDPFWFQSLGCVLGFDWHSSGLTTTTTGALKQGIRGLENDLGLWVAGGKGGTSRKTPTEIETAGWQVGKDFSNLIYSSKMAAKVDTAALQDGFDLYHHNFFFTKNGSWSVVQQGMDIANRWARRYHWLSDNLESFVEEPHAAIASDIKVKPLNLVAAESNQTRKISAALSREKPDKTVKLFEKIREIKIRPGKLIRPALPAGRQSTNQPVNLLLPAYEMIQPTDIKPENLKKILLSTYENQPADFENLLGTKGVGPKTIRALALISDLVYSAPASTRDPVKFTFAHGGKDGTPYPVDRKTYDKSIEILKNAVRKAKIGDHEKIEAIKRLQYSLF